MLIGDYIHYTANGYNEYGIYRKQKSSPVTNFSDFANAEIDKIKCKEVNTTQLEQELNSFFSNAQNGNLTKDQKAAQRAVMRQMNKEFGDKLGNITTTGDVTMSEQQKAKSIGKISDVAKKDRSSLNPKKIMNKIHKLEKTLAFLENEVGNESTEYNTLKTGLNAAKQEAESLYRDFIYDNTIPDSAKAEIERENNIIDKLNSLIKTYAAMPAISLQKGEYFEFLVSYLQGVMNGISIREITKAMKEIKTGGKTEEMKIDDSFFGIKGDEKDELYRINFSENTDMTIKKSQGKVDIIVDVEDQKIGASLKNVNLSKEHAWIHTVSGSNLLYFLQDMAPDFVNHFLNLNAAHKRNTGEINETAKQNSRQAMKRVLAAKALSGATYGRKQADLFIVNNNQTGKVQIFSMGKLTQALKNAKLESFSVKVGGKSINDLNQFENKSVSDDDALGVQRISRLLSSLRKLKLDAGLQASFLRYNNLKT